MHASRGRQILGQGLSDLGRFARGGRIGCQCALDHCGSKCSAQSHALCTKNSRAGCRKGSCKIWARPPIGAAHRSTFTPMSRFSRKPPLQARPPVQNGALQSLSVFRRRNPLKSAIDDGETPQEATFHFPRRLVRLSGRGVGHPLRPMPKRRLQAKSNFRHFGAAGLVEWAINWTPALIGSLQSYCNTVPTPEGGTHESRLLGRHPQGYTRL